MYIYFCNHVNEIADYLLIDSQSRTFSWLVAKCLMVLKKRKKKTNILYVISLINSFMDVFYIHVDSSENMSNIQLLLVAISLLRENYGYMRVTVILVRLRKEW